MRVEELERVRGYRDDVSEPDTATMLAARAELLEAIRNEPTPRTSARAKLRRAQRRRRFALAGGIAVVALAVGGVLGVRDVSISNPPSALAAEMDQLAHIAASQDWTGIPGPGKYLYTESRTQHIAAGNVAACLVSYDEEDQTWIATDGSGALRNSYRHVHFVSPAAQAACASHGQTDPVVVVNPGDDRRGTRFPPGGLGFPTKDWKALSTDPATLLKQIHQQDGGPDTPAEWFTNVADFMRLSDVPPVIRAALYHATALIPGVRSLGTQKTHDGQTGLGVAFYANGQPTHELVFDQQTGRMLGERYYDENGKPASWIDYVDQKIVGSVPDYPWDYK